SSATVARSDAATTAPQHVLTLVSQPAWIKLGGDAPLHVDLASDVSNAVMHVSIHQALATRIGFDRTLQGQSLGSVIAHLPDTPVDKLATDSAGHPVVDLALQDPAAARDSGRLQIRQPGVYPIEVEARDATSGASIDKFVTYLVAVRTPADGSAAIPQPLAVAWIWRIVTQPAYLVNNQPDPGVIAEMQPNGRLGRIAASLSRADGVPITIAPSKPAIADGLQAIENAAKSSANQVLGGSFVPIDIPSLDAHGLGDEVGSQLALGADTLGTTLGLRVDPRTSIVDRVDATALARLRDAGVDHVVLEPDSLQPVSSNFTPAHPFDLESDGRTFRAAADDQGLSRTLSTTDAPALQAQRLLAGLSLVAMERPGEARGIVLSSPSAWKPSTKALDAVVDGLRGHPLLKAVSVDTLFASVAAAKATNGTPVVRQLTPTQPDGTPVSADVFHEARRRLDAFRSMVGVNQPQIADGERALQVSLSSAWVGATGRARAAAELAVINFDVRIFVSKIRVPDGRTITLTSRTARIPLSFTNDTNQSVRVRVRLSSNKLFFPEGATQEVQLPPKTRTVEFQVRTRASGAFPVLIKVTSTDGQLLIQNARLTVRSTVFSGVGIFLTIGAMAFLAIWWLNHFRHNRR
ncbi:MAG TPA: DUF6049 family protein, partial [Acidimicrobiia bacterium]|nr:DUF6049 family protein [Acidimicrobiia bacterium]